MANLHGQMSMFWTLFFSNLIRWIQLFDEKYLTFVDCCDKILLNSFKGSLTNIFQDSFNKILSQQLTHDRLMI